MILFRKNIAKEKEVLGVTESVCASPHSTLITVHRPRLIEVSMTQFAPLVYYIILPTRMGIGNFPCCQPTPSKGSSVSSSSMNKSVFFVCSAFSLHYDFNIRVSMKQVLIKMVFSKNFWKKPSCECLIRR